MSQAATEHADYLFVVKEYSDGSPFLMLEPLGSHLKALGDGFLALELRPGTSMPQARDLARSLNDLVAHVGYTRFRG